MRARRGFTLIELMVSLLVSALLVAMILAVFTRMSVAYRSQQQIADLQQVIAAARSAIEQDAKQAGLECSQGFQLASAPTMRNSPVLVTNSSTSPDQIAFFYADTSKQAAVQSPGGWTGASQVTVDSGTAFAIGDLVVMSTVSTVTNPINPGVDANIATFDACVLRVTAVQATTLSFDESLPWGIGGSSHCLTPQTGTMIYRFVAHAYRIDPARPADGVLQLSYTGGLLGNAEVWQDLALGFTDIQTALYVYDGDAIDTNDPDTDPARDWYSSGDQTLFTQPTLKSNAFKPPLMLSVSLVVRTDREVEGVASAATPQLLDPANINNNTVGDRPAIDLTTTADPALTGSHIFRYTTFQVDLRNLGVGQ